MAQIRAGRLRLEPPMRRSFVALALTAGVAGALATAGAASASADGTPVSFTVTGGGLSVTQPSATAVLTGSGLSLTGTSVSGSLGATTVTDLRGNLLQGWTDNVAGPAAGFSDGASTPHVIADSNATVWVNATDYASTYGVTARTDLHITQLTGVQLSAAQQSLVTATDVVSTTATFTPSIAVAIPAGTVAGTYTGTITQTVS